MAVYEIVKIGDEILRERAKEVTRVNDTICKLLRNMIDTLVDAEGAGLAAPQIGISKRVVVVAAGDRFIELVNPEIVDARGEEIGTEGCLSIPGIVCEVPRAVHVTVTGLDGEGKEVKFDAEGFLARALQHEIDHLNGILIVDKAVKISKIEENETKEDGKIKRNPR